MLAGSLFESNASLEASSSDVSLRQSLITSGLHLKADIQAAMSVNGGKAAVNCDG